MEQTKNEQPQEQSRFRLLLKNRRFRIVSLTIAVLLTLTIGFLVAKGRAPEPVAPDPAPPLPEPVKATLVPSLINGTMVDQAIANRRSVAVIVDNNSLARPQIGLRDADLVYEVYVEGNITRFMAIFSQNLVEKVGPIRSARSYFIDYLSEFDSIFMHAGGSPAALAQISRYKVKDYPHATDGSYWRVSRPNLPTEHTLFASVKTVFDNSISRKGFSPTHQFEPWKFKDSLTPLTNLASTVVINYGGPAYRVDWIFDPATNSYSRNVAAVPHIDALSREQITASTIIVMTVRRSPNAPQGRTGRESEWTMETIGTGPVAIFQDGIRIDGTWRKNSRIERTRFFDSANNEIALNRGKIWVQIVAPTTEVLVD